MTVKFLGGYGTKPIYFFGFVALLLFLAASASGSSCCTGGSSSPSRIAGSPLFLLTVLLVVLSGVVHHVGLLAELMVRTYHESQNRPTYVIREVLETTED